MKISLKMTSLVYKEICTKLLVLYLNFSHCIALRKIIKRTKLFEFWARIYSLKSLNDSYCRKHIWRKLAHPHWPIFPANLPSWITHYPILMHDPICLNTLWWLPLVKHKSLLHTHILGSTVNGLVCPSGLPVTRYRRSIGPGPVRVLPVSWAEEVPFVFPESCLLCTPQGTKSS